MSRPDSLAKPGLPAAGTAAASAYGRLPMRFEENVGQFDADVRFVAAGSESQVRLDSRGATVSGGGGSIQIEPVGANPSSAVVGRDRLNTVSNYFVGDSSRWRTGVSNYGEVVYHDVYPGIDAVYYGAGGGGLEYDFVVAPGADPAQIALRFNGATHVGLDGTDLVVSSAAGEALRQHRPVLYQDSAGSRRPVTGELTVDSATGVTRFNVGPYDHSRPLVIDPVLQYSTYLGGDGTDAGYSIAVDRSGAAFVTGETSSDNFPTTNAIGNPGNPACAATGRAVAGLDLENCPDVFVAKINPAGDGLVYSTHIGGALSDVAYGIALGPGGEAYVTGETHSIDFPVTTDAYQHSLTVTSDIANLQDVAAAQGDKHCGNHDTCGDAFVVRLGPTGTLGYSSYLGGSFNETGSSIAVDSAGHVHVAGTTTSGSGAVQPFPTTTSLGTTGFNSAFYVTLTPGSPTLDFSVLLDGPGTSSGRGLALGSDGLAYIVGQADSGFPTKSALQTAYAGGPNDAFVAIVDPSKTGASALVAATYLGGSSDDFGDAIAIDGRGGVYVAGATRSFDFPIRGAPQPIYGGQIDIFVTKLVDGVSNLSYSTFLGQGQQTAAAGISVDSTGAAYVAGWTYNGGRQDALIATLNPTGAVFDFVSVLAGFDTDVAAGIAVNATGAYVVGSTRSSDFPTKNAMSSTLGGSSDAFVAKVAPASHAVADFDGNGATDASVFRRSSATWFADSGTALGWGASGDVAVPADYDGDGKADEAIFRPSTGLWAIHGSAGADTFVTYGVGSDIPVPADYDGDGKTDVAVYRPSTGTWFIHRSLDGADIAVTFGGIAGDVAVPADYDRDGKADLAIFRSGTWYVHPSAGPADTAVSWGASGDIPVPADYGGDAKADIAIYRPSTGLWAVHPSAGGADTFLTYGVGGDVPVPADYDGDGHADIAIFRPSTGAWFEHRGGLSPTATDTVVTFGISGDVVLPLPEAIRRAYF